MKLNLLAKMYVGVLLAGPLIGLVPQDYSPTLSAAPLRLVRDAQKGTLSVLREGSERPVLTQNARADFRPYLHPIEAPDGKGTLTQYSPSHHLHQTGLYWGVTRINGRDYFHHPEGSHWRRVSFEGLEGLDKPGDRVRWRTVYELLAEDASVVLVETQTWSLHEEAPSGKPEFVLDLEWKAEAKTDVTVSRYDYGGLFLRMPWKPGTPAEVVNSARQRGVKRTEGQRALWLDLGMQVPGRDDLAHVAIFDHPKNKGFPQPWRVDGQFGVGPSRARLGDWKIGKGQAEVVRHQLRIFTGELDESKLTQHWQRFSGQGGTWAQWRLAQEEGRKATFLKPQEALEAMTVKDGFVANVWAAEPMLTQPMAFCWDDRGRLWIAENRDYENRGRGFANDGNSRILILEDVDKDGVADTRKVFAEGIAFPAGVAVGFDGSMARSAAEPALRAGS